MKALVYNGPNNLSIQEAPDISPVQGQVFIKVKTCGICGSDIHGYTGKTGRRIPTVIMGHEFAGVVADTGADVRSIKKGQRVTVQPIIYCGLCEECLSGRTNSCAKKECLGVMSLNGAMAEYICVEERFVKKLPDSVSFLQSAVIEPLAVAYRAVNRLDVEGKTVLLVGAGTIGLLVLKMLISQGAGQVIISDLSDYRLTLAKKFGAKYTVNSRIENIQHTVSNITNGKGVDISIEAVGISQTVSHALDCLKNSGQCIWIGNSSKMIEINMQQIVTRELSIFGTYSYTDNDFDKALELIADGKIIVDSIVDSQVSLEEAPKIFESLANGADQPVKCIIVFD